MFYSPHTKLESKQGEIADRRGTGLTSRLRRVNFAAMDELSRWLFANDINTLEKMLITFRIAMGLGIVIMSTRIISIPPPYLQFYFLTLPTWAWAMFLSICVFWQLNGRREKSLAIRRNASLFSSIIILMLLGPLFSRAPGMGTLAMIVSVFELTVFVRLRKLRLAEISDSQ